MNHENPGVEVRYFLDGQPSNNGDQPGTPVLIDRGYVPADGSVVYLPGRHRVWCVEYNATKRVALVYVWPLP